MSAEAFVGHLKETHGYHLATSTLYAYEKGARNVPEEVLGVYCRHSGITRAALLANLPPDDPEARGGNKWVRHLVDRIDQAEHSFAILHAEVDRAHATALKHALEEALPTRALPVWQPPEEREPARREWAKVLAHAEFALVIVSDAWLDRDDDAGVALDLARHLAARSGRAIPLAVYFNTDRRLPASTVAPSWPRYIWKGTDPVPVAASIAARHRGWLDNSLVRSAQPLFKRLSRHASDDIEAQLKRRWRLLTGHDGWAGLLGFDKPEDVPAPRPGNEHWQLVLNRLRWLSQDDAAQTEVALAALVMLLAPNEWPWVSAAYKIIPGWFKGPGDDAFQSHFNKRLGEQVEIASRAGQVATVSVLGADGEQLQRYLHGIAPMIENAVAAGRQPPFRNLIARILVDNPTGLNEEMLRVRAREDAYRRAGVRVAVRILTSPAPFHGNFIGRAAAWEQPEDGPLVIKDHEHEHLYLGHRNPPTSQQMYRPYYLYLDRYRGHAMSAGDANPMWYVEDCFRSFLAWFEFLWSNSKHEFDLPRTVE